jgi:hypothetical protein
MRSNRSATLRRHSAKWIATLVGTVVLVFAVAAEGQSPAAKPWPEMKQWEVCVGKWKLIGTAKDSPTSQEYKVDWREQGRWILGGYFVELQHVWKGNGAEAHQLEILSYDPIKKILTASGFGSDGTTWLSKATFNNEKLIEEMTFKGPNGESTTCRNTWVYSNNRTAVSGTQECEENGVRWTFFKVKGIKSGTAQVP